MTEAAETGYSALAIPVRHINASARDPISEETLLTALTGDDLPPRWEHHIRAFFDETDLISLGNLVRSRVITYERLARRARHLLPPRHPTLQWLEARASL